MNTLFKTIFSKNLLDWTLRYGLLILIVLIFVFFSLMEPSFLRIRNIFTILQSLSIVAILALGITASLAIGGFDLSIGAVAASSMMASSYAMVILETGALAAILISLSIGVTAGICNSFLIVKMRIPDLLASLGMMFLIQGLQRIPTAGHSIATGVLLPNGETAEGIFSPAFLLLGRHRFFDIIPAPVIIMLLLAALIWVFLEFTKWGRILYAIGSNEQASRLAGAAVEKHKTAAYIISGTYASIGGILLAARLGRGDVGSGNFLLLDAVSAALVGFAVLGAAKPNAFGTIVGALFVGMLINGLTMLNVPYYTQDFIKGSVLVLALAFTFGLSKHH